MAPIPKPEPKKRKSKYSNKTCKCCLGHIHDSRGEAGYCDQLSWMLKVKEIKSFESQVKYSMDVNGKHICNHYVDFIVTKNDGSLEAHEYKGFRTAMWIMKKKLFEALYPEIPYIVINHC